MKYYACFELSQPNSSDAVRWAQSSKSINLPHQHIWNIIETSKISLIRSIGVWFCADELGNWSANWLICSTTKVCTARPAWTRRPRAEETLLFNKFIRWWFKRNLNVSPSLPDFVPLTPVTCIWFLMSFFSLKTKQFFLYFPDAAFWNVPFNAACFSSSSASWYISRWLFWITLNDEISLIWRVNVLIQTSYCAEFRIFVCRGCFNHVCLFFDCSIRNNSFARLYRQYYIEHWYASKDQRVFIGWSDHSLLFSIGPFHTISFLRHPEDCADFICFWTLQYFRYVLVGATWWWWRTLAAAAVGVCGGGATPCPRRLCRGRRRRLRKPTPATADHRDSRRWRDFATCVRPDSAGFRAGLTDAQKHRSVVCWTKKSCNPNPVCRCISSTILLQAGAPNFKEHVIWNIYIPGSAVICQVYIWYIHYYDTPDFAVICQVYTWYISYI